MGRISGTALLQADLVPLLKALRNRVFSNPGLAVGSTNTRIQVTNAVQFAIDGVQYNKAAEDNITIAALTATAAAQNRRVRVEVNTAGTVSFVEGPALSTAAPAPPLEAPARTASRATLGYFDMPASFTPGTTAASGLTYVNGDPDLDTTKLEA